MSKNIGFKGSDPLCRMFSMSLEVGLWVFLFGALLQPILRAVLF